MFSPASKKLRTLGGSLRPELLKEDVLSHLKSAWTSASNSAELESIGIKIIQYPFPVCIIYDFIHNSELLRLAAEELNNVTFYQKSNDLYQFKQSDDVRNLSNLKFIPQLYELICIEGLTWLEKILGKDNVLRKEISATFSCYEYQDRLLCHDDKCEDRHVAFILYLVENWNEEDGGALQLFTTDSSCYPDEIVASIYPQFNTMVFFEVTHQSFHQVSEVMSKTKKRLSLNGWFHSSLKKPSDQETEKHDCSILKLEGTLGNSKNFDLESYFLFSYLEHANKLDIKQMLMAESEIQLQEFLVPKFWEKIKKDLKNGKLIWKCKGPANVRKYEMAEPSSFPPFLCTLKEIFESMCWFRYLESITGLSFAPSETSDLKIWEKGCLPHCNFELQRWTHSCYTLMHDRDPEFHSKALDVILRIPIEEKERENFDDVPESGHIVYIDADSKDEECLLHIGYKMNSLALIFRDKKTLRFTKYLDCTAEPFYQVFCTYRPWTPPPDQPNLKHCEEDSESTGSNSESEHSSEGEC